MKGARSRAKAHKLMADRYAMEGNAHKAAAHYKRAFEYGLRFARFGGDERKPQCIICLDHDPPPMQSGLRVSRRRRTSAREMLGQEGSGATAAQAAVHGLHANAARGGMVRASAR